jgi:hypothetical protein
MYQEYYLDCGLAGRFSNYVRGVIMKNKQVKQMIVDSLLQGRKAFWHGEESEVYAAKSLQCLDEEFGVQDDYCYDKNGNVAWSNYKTWWKPCLSEKCWDSKNGKFTTKGKTVYNKDGELVECHEILPLICAVYGDKEDIAMITTSYN